MSSKAVSVVDSANWLWFQAQATASGGRNLSVIPNEVLARLRASGQAKAVRSVRGTAGLLAETDEAQA